MEQNYLEIRTNQLRMYESKPVETTALISASLSDAARGLRSLDLDFISALLNQSTLNIQQLTAIRDEALDFAAKAWNEATSWLTSQRVAFSEVATICQAHVHKVEGVRWRGDEKLPPPPVSDE